MPKNHGTAWVPEAVKLYESGWTLGQIGEKFGCSYKTVAHRIRPLTTIRPRGGGKRPTLGHPWEAEAIRLYDTEELPVQEVAARVRASCGAVLRVLHRAGVVRDHAALQRLRERRGGRQHGAAMTPEWIEKATAMYASGVGARGVAAALGGSLATVMKHMHKAGIARPRSGAPVAAPADET